MTKNLLALLAFCSFLTLGDFMQCGGIYCQFGDACKNPVSRLVVFWRC